MQNTYIVKVGGKLIKPQEFKTVFGVHYTNVYKHFRKLEKGTHTEIYRGVTFTVEIW
jgi:hypothetical protein